MTQAWRLHEAKSKFNELIERAYSEGPQVVTRRGLESVVIVSIDEYRKLTAPRDTLVSFFKCAPRVDLDIERGKDTDRKVDL